VPRKYKAVKNVAGGGGGSRMGKQKNTEKRSQGTSRGLIISEQRRVEGGNAKTGAQREEGRTILAIHNWWKIQGLCGGAWGKKKMGEHKSGSNAEQKGIVWRDEAKNWPEKKKEKGTIWGGPGIRTSKKATDQKATLRPYRGELRRTSRLYHRALWGGWGEAWISAHKARGE